MRRTNLQGPTSIFKELWRVITDRPGVLWVQNLFYILFADSFYILTYLWFTFHAKIFLVLSLLAGLLLGIALCALSEIIKIAVDEVEQVQVKSFWTAVTTKVTKGLLIGIIIDMGVVFLALPAWKAAFQRNYIILCLCLFWLLVLFTLSNYLLPSTTKVPLKRLVLSSIATASAFPLHSLVLGIVRLLWNVLSILFPYMLLPLHLLGVPIIGNILILLNLRKIAGLQQNR